jgi:hypothetical protein
MTESEYGASPFTSLKDYLKEIHDYPDESLLEEDAADYTFRAKSLGVTPLRLAMIEQPLYYILKPNISIEGRIASTTTFHAAIKELAKPTVINIIKQFLTRKGDLGITPDFSGETDISNVLIKAVQLTRLYDQITRESLNDAMDIKPNQKPQIIH